MEINYELTPKDYFKFTKENAPSQNTHKPFVAVFSIIFCVFILADVLYSLFFGALSDWNVKAFLQSIVLRTIITFAAILVVLGGIKIYTNYLAKKVSEEPQNGLFCEHRIILTQKELIELTDVNTARYSWQAIGEIKELENFITLNVFMSNLFIIPKKHFRDRNEINDFLQTALQYQQNAENNFQLSHFIEYEKSLQ